MSENRNEPEPHGSAPAPVEPKVLLCPGCKDAIVTFLNNETKSWTKNGVALAVRDWVLKHISS